MDGYGGLLVVSFGGPERTEDVMPFLRHVTAGRGIPESRIAGVAQHYYDAGGASPVNASCRDLLAALRPPLDDLGLALYWGNRNWHPFLADTLAQMRDDGVARALALVTSAYGGYSSCRQYLDDIAAARRRVGAGAPEVSKLRLFYNHPGWCQAWATSLAAALDEVAQAWPGLGGASTGPGPGPAGTEPGAGHDGGQDSRGPVEILFSAHSIPLSMAATSPYVEHVNETARLCAEQASLRSWRLVWQSRSGGPGSPWLGPDITEVIAGSAARAIVVVPIGFVCDNMEIVHDLDVEAAAAAKVAGASYFRARTVTTSPAFVDMVRSLVLERLGQAPRPALGTLGPWPDACPVGHCPAPPGAGPPSP